MSDVATPILRTVWIPSCDAIPTHTSEVHVSGAFIATRIARRNSATNNSTIIVEPKNPSSSHTIENIKSLYGSGRFEYF